VYLAYSLMGRLSLFFASAVGTVLATIGTNTKYVAVTVAVSTAVSRWLFSTMVEEQRENYERAVSELTCAKLLWEALPNEQRSQQAMRDRLVLNVEGFIEACLPPQTSMLRVKDEAPQSGEEAPFHARTPDLDAPVASYATDEPSETALETPSDAVTASETPSDAVSLGGRSKQPQNPQKEPSLSKTARMISPAGRDRENPAEAGPSSLSDLQMPEASSSADTPAKADATARLAENTRASEEAAIHATEEAGVETKAENVTSDEGARLAAEAAAAKEVASKETATVGAEQGSSAEEAVGEAANTSSVATAAAATATAGGAGTLQNSWDLDGWVRSLDVHKIVARALTPREGVDHFEHAKRLTADSSLQMLVSARVAEACASAIKSGAEQLRDQGAATASGLNEKFGDQGFDLSFGGLDTFFGGLEALVGSPNPKTLEGMRRDHCEGADADFSFTAPNYHITTSARIEWWFVHDPLSGLGKLDLMDLSYYPGEPEYSLNTLEKDGVPASTPRHRKPPSDFEDERSSVNARLAELSQPQVQLEELLGCRLYTGPMYVKYNGVLRALQIPEMKPMLEQMMQGNKYTTTLHTINSGIVKMSKLTVAAKVYRGVSNGKLPKSFREPNQFNVRGGVEPAFMSTTLDRAVATTYAASRDGPSVIFEIQMGMVDRGADIGWLSQFPHEKEILFNPLTGMEMHSVSVMGTTVVCDTTLSINLSAQTIEQVVERRRKMLQDMEENMKLEVQGALTGTGFEKVSVSLIAKEVVKKENDAAWYNNDENFEAAVKEVLTAKQGVLEHATRLPLMQKHLNKGELAPFAQLMLEILAKEGTDNATRDAVGAVLALVVRIADISAAKLREARFPLQHLRATGYGMQVVEEAGYPAAELWRAGFVRCEYHCEVFNREHDWGGGRPTCAKCGAWIVTTLGAWHGGGRNCGEAPTVEASVQDAVFNCLRLFPNESHLVGIGSAVSEKELTVYRTADAVVMGRCIGCVSSIRVVATDGVHIASGDVDGQLHLWEATGSLNHLGQLPNSHGKRTVLGLALRGDLLVSSSYDQTAKLWSIAERKPYATLMEHTNKVNCVDANEKLIITCSDDNTAKVFPRNSAHGARSLFTLEHPTFVYAGTFCAVGTPVVATACCDLVVRTWSLETGTMLLSLSGHTGVPCGVALCGMMLVSAANDKTVKLWSLDEAAAGECLATLKGHKSEARGAVIARSKGLIATQGACSPTTDAPQNELILWMPERPDGGEHPVVGQLKVNSQR
jgi:hypothetical protein